MSYVHIEKIEIAKKDCVCYRCKSWILKGDFRLKGFIEGNDRYFCMDCGGKIIDKLDRERLKIQLNNDNLNL